MNDRTKTIGASDAPVIAGVSPWQTPYQLWREKTGRTPAREATDAMSVGTRLEPLVLEATAKAIGKAIVPNRLEDGSQASFRPVVDSTVPYSATPDAWAEARYSGVLVEAKTSSRPEEWGEDWTDQIPEVYRPQVQQQMRVLGAGRCIVSVVFVPPILRRYLLEAATPEALQAIFDTLDMRIFEVFPDPEWWEWYHVQATAFWLCVTSDTPPASITEADAKAQWAKASDRALEADDELARIVGKIRILSASIKVEEAEHKALRAALMNRMKDASRLLHHGQEIASWKNVRAFDHAAFRAAHPDIAAAYCRKLAVKEFRADHPDMHNAFCGQGPRRLLLSGESGDKENEA